MLKKLNLSQLTGLIAGGAIDVKWMGLLGLSFSSKLDWGSYIASIAKAASRKIGTLICSMKSLSPVVAPCFCKSNIWLCMEYCCRG